MDERKRTDSEALPTPQTLGEEIRSHVILLMQGNPVGVAFFQERFKLGEGRPFTSPEQFLVFVMTMFMNTEDDETAFFALLVIGAIVSIPEACAFISQAFLSPEVAARMVQLLSHPNKHFSREALSVIDTLIGSDDNVYGLFMSMGLHTHMIESVPPPSEPFYGRNMIILGYALETLLQHPYGADEVEVFIAISMFLICGDSEEGAYRGFRCLDKLAWSGVPIPITDDLKTAIMRCALVQKASVLDFLFSFIAHVPFRDEVVAWLIENGFFVQLFTRISQGEDNLAVYVFKFMNVIEYTPDASDPVIPLAISLIGNGSIRTRSNSLKFIHTLMHKLPPAFTVAVVEAGVIPALVELLELQPECNTEESDEVNSPDTMEESLKAIMKIIDTLKAGGINLTMVTGIDTVDETLYSLLGELDGIYDPLIEHLIEAIHEDM